MASYHFEEEGSYISYETIEQAPWFNSALPKCPKKKFFQNFEYDPKRRTVSAEISWEDNPIFDNEALWKYLFVFSEDFTRVETGFCLQFYKNDVGKLLLKREFYFSTDLKYHVHESLEAKELLKVMKKFSDHAH